MKVCICSGRCSVLVNGSPREEVSIQKRLKQGDPLSPFLYLLVAEGLSCLMEKAVTTWRFKGCELGNDGPSVQYADDTILVGDANWGNLWVMKAVLRCFELVSGLKVNFKKIKSDWFECRSIVLNFRRRFP